MAMTKKGATAKNRDLFRRAFWQYYVVLKRPLIYCIEWSYS